MASLKIALLTSLLCIILGVGVMIGGGIAIPLVNSAIDNLQSTASSYLQQADLALASAQNAINSTQATLVLLNPNVSLPAGSGQLVSNAGSNLSTAGNRLIAAGDSLSNSSIFGFTALASVGSTITSIGQRINSAANGLTGVSSGLNTLEQSPTGNSNLFTTVTVQLGNLNSSLTDLRTSIAQTQNTLSSIFNPVRLVAILAIVALIGLGAVFLLIGLSLFTLRRRQLHYG